ncbi:esterase/lipase family protein [Alkalicoccobacillus murimartini]|uniref:Triacylglycerol lipase n=1 Tax=Alkalicoccobacillus murimartini TaxID=171685 RepID=A0ABT9YL08_9BACI|nr:lipase [Alkalicoccobacillus murimartini]MDQ0208555.1 triacylglycerol lipase [Alkalicoccobacillus murimartini]
MQTSRIFVILTSLTLFLLCTPMIVEAGSFGKGDPYGPVGEWYIGEDPISPNDKPPVLFVHGYNSSSLTWWEDNDMYDLFRDAGYQTAFINLHPDKDMWKNGEILSDKLEEIYQHFGEELMVIAHSKGGLDTQTALVHFDAEPYISRVVTLSSPHHGSELADLAHSNWASWLTGIIGARSEATESLQTGAMSQFRTQTDSLAQEIDIPFYTISGNDPGSFSSALYWGRMYLNSYGENDGSVTVNHSKLSYAYESTSGPWNHTEVKTGEFTYPFVEPLLRAEASYHNHEKQGIPYETGSIIRGGEFEEQVETVFNIEPNVDTASVHFLAPKQLENAQLIAPDGKEYTLGDIHQEEENAVFEGAWTHSIEVENPPKGEWTINVEGEPQDETIPYMLVVGLEGGVSGDVKMSSNSADILLDENTLDHNKTSYTIHMDDVLVVKDSSQASLQSRSLPYDQEGAYTITVDVSGETSDQSTFERTFIYNIYIDKNGNKLTQ